MGSLQRYIIRRIIQIIPALFAVLIINFLLINLAPGDPIDMYQGEYPVAPEVKEAIRQKWGLDKPIYERLFIYLSNVLRGDLGFSYLFYEPVVDIILRRTGVTLFLMFSTFVLSVTTGSWLGAYSARKFGTRTDDLISTVVIVCLSIPVFWLGLLLMRLFAFQLGILPSTGMIDPLGNHEGINYYLDVLRHSILPVTVLFITSFPSYFMVARASIVEVMREDFVLLARAKGLTEGNVFRRHALRNALLPVVTLSGLWIGFALTGAVLTETVFSWPGMGRLLYDSIAGRDYPVLMGIFFFTAILVLVANLVTDILYGYLDPRVTLT